MISIIIPTFNRLNALKRCLDSVINQQQDDIEIIVIDDCSTDGSRSFLNDIYVNSDNLIVLFNEYNAGVNFTRNRGIKIASKPFILFLDSDDALLPNTLSQLKTAIEKNPLTNHFLSYLSYRSKEFVYLKESEWVYYKQWMSGAFNGDFTHLLRTSIMRQYLFFEEFRMFEQLNWYRILRDTSPQLLLPFAVANINLDSADSLMKATKAKTWEAVDATFMSEAKFYDMYAQDLAKYNPQYLKFKLIRNILLGMACKKRAASKQLIHYAAGFHIKIAAYLITIFPYWLVRFAFVKSGRVK